MIGFRESRTRRILAAAALVQLAVLGWLLVLRETPGARAARLAELVPTVGDRLPELAGRFASSANTGCAPGLCLDRDDGRWTAVLAFTSTCRWCESVAPAWRDWISQRGALVVVGLTKDSLAAARRFSERYGLTWDILSVAQVPSGTRERLMAGRTPWIYLFDELGMLRFKGHGSRLAAIDSVFHGYDPH